MTGQILTEKYRPQTLDDVIGQPLVIEILKGLVNAQKSGKQNIGNLMFSGCAGTGKTTTARALARELGQDLNDFNASDERGIEAIRGRIKELAKTKSFTDFKIIFLDEADNLTQPAQYALRRIMEDNSNTCKFILSVNYPNKIIDAIQTRCSILHFLPISELDINKYLTMICKAEKINLTLEVITAISMYSEMNLRSAINVLSMVSVLEKPTPAKVMEIVGADGQGAEKIYSLIKANDPKKASEKFMHHYFNGMTVGFFLEYVFKRIQADESIPNDVKTRLNTRWSDYEFYVRSGGNEIHQCESMIWFMAGTLAG
jgi:replication factor C small subunit